MGAARARLRPVPGWGALRATRLWRVVLAVWVVMTAAFLPALWVVEGAVGPSLGRLPEQGVAAGDVLLIVVDSLRPAAPALLLAVASGLVVVWLFTVLWQAGVVRWELWAGERKVRLGEVLGLGMVAWWPYARLSLTASVVLGAALWGGWRSLTAAMKAAYHAMNEQRVEALLLGGIAGSLVLVLVVMAATLRGAWLLGRPRSRSALAAWWRGLYDTMRTPVASLGTVLLWVLPAVLVSALPIVAGSLIPSLRGGWALPILTGVATALRAFCWVGLFASFASASGVLGADAAAVGDGNGAGGAAGT